MFTTTFRPLGDVAEFVVMKSDFLRALNAWSGRPEDEFPRSAPPVYALKDDQSDESAELAAVFLRLCRLPTMTDRLSLLAADVIVHERRYGLAWDLAKGEPDPRKRASREGLVALRPYQQMIDVLRDWLEALHDAACTPSTPSQRDAARLDAPPHHATPHATARCDAAQLSSHEDQK